MNARTVTTKGGFATAINGKLAAVAIVATMLLLSVFGGAAIGQADNVQGVGTAKPVVVVNR